MNLKIAPIITIAALAVTNIGMGIGVLSMSQMLSASHARQKYLMGQVESSLQAGEKMGTAFASMEGSFNECMGMLRTASK